MIKTSVLALMVASGTVMAACALPPLPARTPSPIASPAAPGTPIPRTDAAADEMEALRELVMRLISPPPYAFGDSAPPVPELFIGRVPPLFPSDLPIPEGARIVGGIARGEVNADLIVDAIQPPEDTIAFIEAKLLAAGWQTPTLATQPGGFVTVPFSSKTLCRSADGPVIYISATQLANGTTDLRYGLQTFKDQHPGFYFPCKAELPPGYMGPPEFPTLVAPQGARQYDMGGSGSQITQAQYVTIETELSTQALRKHYDAQLQQAGWTALESGGDDRVAWSTWSFRDREGKPQRGLLFVLQRDASSSEKFVHLQMTRGAAGSAQGAPAIVRETIRQQP